MKRKPDIILDNKFNTGDLNFVQLPEIKLDPAYKQFICEDKDFYESQEATNLEEFINEYSLKLNQEGLFIDKKDYVNNVIIFYKIYENLDTMYYDCVQYFTMFCETFQLDYRNMYINLLPRMKGDLIDKLLDKTLIKPKFIKIF